MLDLQTITSTGALRLVDGGEGIGVLEIDVPGRPVNVLTSAVLEDIEKALAAIAKDSRVRALVVTGGKAGSATFIAGADIDEIRAVADAADATAKSRRGQEVLGGFSRFPRPTVVAINGNCLGGGTELALACDLRVAADDDRIQIALPEILLGIFPGFGGSQRLPRLIGIRAALDLILTGKRIPPRKAAQIGLVDRVAPAGSLRDAALALAREALRHRKGWRPHRRRKLGQRLGAFFLEKNSWGLSMIRRAALRQIAAQGGGHYPAPARAVDAVIDGSRKRLDAALEMEANLVGPLVAGEVSKGLIHVFKESEALRRDAHGSPEQVAARGCAPSTSGPAKCGPAKCGGAPRRIAVLGAGVMGGGIAALLARRGIRTRLKDLKTEPLTAALRTAAKSFDELVSRRRMTSNERENCLASISATTDHTGLGCVEMVIEAVVESLDVKRQVLREVEPHLAEGAIFASNTSALSITALAEASVRPERVVGLHFFNPVHRMPLVEVVRGARTSEETLQAAEKLARELGKYPVRVKDGPGFLVNRLLMPYLNEAAHLFDEGCSMEALDRAARGFGFPMGPFELLDEVGLDVASKVAHILHAAFGERSAPSPFLDRMVTEMKLLGKKGRAGFYRHGKKKKRPNPAILRWNRPAAGTAPVPDPLGWLRRMLFPMANEAARCLEEGIVASPGELDVATVFGMAFPPFRGGLCAYADWLGLGEIVQGLNGFAGSAGGPSPKERFRPAALLERLAAEKKGFASLGRHQRAPEEVTSASR